MVPHLVTALTGPINELEARILESMPAIERWFRLEWMEHTPPFYSSVDLRNAGFKLAPVDTNLFPGGFNNLNPAFLPLCVQATMSAVEKFCPDARDVLLIPENHTRNQFYLINVARLVHTLHAARIPTPVLAEAIRADIGAFSSATQALDDRSLIVLRNRVVPEPGCVHTDLDLPWDLDGLAPLHTELRAFARAAGLADARVDALVLACFEAGSNIIRHARPVLDDARIHCGFKSDPDGVRVRLDYLGPPFTPRIKS